MVWYHCSSETLSRLTTTTKHPTPTPLQHKVREDRRSRDRQAFQNLETQIKLDPLGIQVSEVMHKSNFSAQMRAFEILKHTLEGPHVVFSLPATFQGPKCG